MKLKHDGSITISVGASRKSLKWNNKKIKWSELVDRLGITQRTPETQKEYKKMPRAKRDAIKDVGGFVGGSIKGGRRKANAVEYRQLLTLDIDTIPAGDDPWFIYTLSFGHAAVIYSTHSHSKESQRLRLLMPLSRPVTPDEYAALSRRIAGDIDIEMCDDTTYEAHRLMYWPSSSIDADYRFEALDGPWLDVDEQLARYKDWRNVDEWPASSRQKTMLKSLANKQGDPLEKPGVVGAFCRVYSVEDVIDNFLEGTYQKSTAENRYDYIPADSSAGLIVYDNGKFVYSHHASDPINGRLCNAFDLMRLHAFGDLDDDSKSDTPISRLPSHLAMLEIAANDVNVRKELAETRLRELIPEFGDDEEFDWLGSLKVTAKGDIESSIDNIIIILKNDPELKGAFYYDEFRKRFIVCGDLPWQKMQKRLSDNWNDSDDAGLRHWLERKYKIESTPKTYDAVNVTMMSQTRHPVREYLNSLEWDGSERADSIFIDYLGAEDNTYTREVTRKALVGAVARIMQPGCKHDHILVLVGPQGCRKSTTLAKLGKQWFSDSLYTVAGKDAFEQLQGKWIIEMGEMAATRKAELEQIKQFVSKQADTFRAAYGRRTEDHPRQCTFFGSTNDEEFLRDPTGGRRFWPVLVTNAGRERADELTDEVIDQIWAEVLIRYELGEQWYLSEEAERMARKVQEAHTELSDKQGLIEDFLETLIPENWDERTLDERLMFYNGGFGGDEKGTEQRRRVCALEIWLELFRGNLKDYTQMHSREITSIFRKIKGWKRSSSAPCGEPYGRQRAFIREAAEP